MTPDDPHQFEEAGKPAEPMPAPPPAEEEQVPMTILPEERAAMRARCEAATAGTWRIGTDERVWCESPNDEDSAICEQHLVGAQVNWENDAEFIAQAHQDLPKALDALKAAEREIASLRNQSGDDLCWIKDGEAEWRAQALPETEFLESCRRYHTQITSERGTFTGGMTIAQLEAEVHKLLGVIESSNAACRRRDEKNRRLRESLDTVYDIVVNRSNLQCANPGPHHQGGDVCDGVGCVLCGVMRVIDAARKETKP